MSERENRPVGDRAASKIHGSGYTDHHTVLHGRDRVEPLDAEDRADLAVLEAAAERGYRLSTQCTACGHWLTSRKSLLSHMGPKCRAKAVTK